MAEDHEVEIPKRVTRSFIALCAVFAILLSIMGCQQRQVRDLSDRSARLAEISAKLSQENADRISDIQSARAASCRRTYEGIREVFKPFFPPKPNARQKADQDKFNRTVDRLKANCNKQTRTEG